MEVLPEDIKVLKEVHGKVLIVFLAFVICPVLLKRAQHANKQ